MVRCLRMEKYINPSLLFKNVVNILLFSILFICCDSSDEQEEEKSISNSIIHFSPKYEEFEEENQVKKIYLDSLSDFKELMTRMHETACEGLLSGLIFSDKNQTYKEIGYARCPDFNGVACYMHLHIIEIRNEQIVEYPNKESIDHLKTKLDELQNLNNNITNQWPFFIHYTADPDFPIARIEQVLKRIINELDNITVASSQKNKYFLHFDFHSMVAPPPPPMPLE